MLENKSPDVFKNEQRFFYPYTFMLCTVVLLVVRLNLVRQPL
jgi:hypothetical protein